MIAWLLRNVKVSKAEVMDALDRIDIDHDGFYSLGEIVTVLKKLKK